MCSPLRLCRLFQMLLLAVTAIFMPGIGLARPVFRQTTPQPVNPAAAQPPSVPQKQAGAERRDPFENLKPQPSGPGVVVCAPVPTGADAALAEFGDGCGRLIQWHLSNYGELGKMPMLDRVFETMQNNKLPNLRLHDNEALAFGKAMSVTHVVTGTLTGNQKQCTLTYQLIALATGKSTGEPIRLSGTPEEVAGQLPQTTQTLAKQLCVNLPAMPTMTRLSWDDVRAIGHYDWNTLADIPRADAARLAQAGAHDSLAAFMVKSKSLWMSDAEEAKAQAVLNEAAPHHLLLLAELVIALSAPPEKYATQIQAFRDRYSVNFISSLLYVRLERARGDKYGEQAIAAWSVLCYRNLTILYTALGRKKEAIALYKEWLAKGPVRAAVQQQLKALQ